MHGRIQSGVMAWLLTAGSLLHPAGARPAPARSVAAEEYQVLNAYLTSPFAEKGPFALYEKIGIFFIYNVNPERPENISGFFRQYAGLELNPDLVRRFVAANRRFAPVDRSRFPARFNYSDQVMKKDVYSLSRVGISPSGDEALMYATFSSMQEDGHGSLVYLRKTGGAWSVAKATAVWMYGASVHPFNP